MARSTGPILVAGATTWANQTLLGKAPESVLDNTVRIGVATGLLAGALFGIEKISPELATGLAWLALVTVLLVRVPGKTGHLEPTPLEKALNLVQ